MPKPSGFGYLRLYEPGLYNTDEYMLGGVCMLLSNDANNTLKLGDSVLMSGNKKVDKIDGSASTLFKGIVIGGKQTDYRIPEGLTTTLISSGINAALANEDVLVLIDGTFWAIASAAISVGASVGMSATVGKVAANETAGQCLGWNIGAAALANNDVILLNVARH